MMARESEFRFDLLLSKEPWISIDVAVFDAQHLRNNTNADIDSDAGSIWKGQGYRMRYEVSLESQLTGPRVLMVT